MKSQIITITLTLFFGLASSVELCHAEFLERSCECQGFGRSGDSVPESDEVANKGNLTQARREAVEDCRAGTYYRGAHKVCTLPECPPGSIDVTPLDENGRSKLVDCSARGGDIERTFDRSRDGDGNIVHRHNPAAAGCQIYDGAYQCSLACRVIRQCAL